MKNTKNKCYPFLAESLNSLGFAEAEYNFLKYSAPLPLASLLFPFSPNRGGGGIWQLLECMFRICLMEQFSWSLDRNAFSLKDWNYELSERIWINTRWMLGLCLLLLCFVFLIRINQSSQNDWCRSKDELRVWGNGSSPCCDFTLLTKSGFAGLGCSFAKHQQHFPGVVRMCTVWVLACLAVWTLESGRDSIIPGCACAFSLLRTSFISCPALSSGWVSLCLISSLSLENSAHFHRRLC